MRMWNYTVKRRLQVKKAINVESAIVSICDLQLYDPITTYVYIT